MALCRRHDFDVSARQVIRHCQVLIHSYSETENEMASKEITPELIKRVETALKTANIAMRSLRDENKRLKEQIAQLEERLKAGKEEYEYL